MQLTFAEHFFNTMKVLCDINIEGVAIVRERVKFKQVL